MNRAMPISAFWMKLLGALFLALFGVIWEHVEAQRLQRQVISLRRESDRLTYETALLRTQIHKLTAPSHLDETARKNFNMEPIGPEQIVGMTSK